MIHSKTVVEDIKIYHLLREKEFIVILEIFKTPTEYITSAHSNLLKHDDFVGMANHKKKGRSARLAIKDLYKLIEEK